MKKSILISSALLLFILAVFANGTQAQMGPGRMGPGFGMGPGMMGGWVDVPEKLPPPKNAEWVQKLREVLALERTSLSQYILDAEKYNAGMPYMMVIPQEEDHVDLIERLFWAYGIKADGTPGPTVETGTLKETFELCARMEQDLILRYTWLVQKAEDRDSALVLNHILLQTRMHLAMFQHALGMGGYGMGPGMMRGGMMGGRRMGPGYGYQYPRQPQGPLGKDEVKSMLENYLRSTRNPNLKLGKIEDKGSYFEAQIVTRDNSLVDEIIVDKKSGWMHPQY